MNDPEAMKKVGAIGPLACPFPATMVSRDYLATTGFATIYLVAMAAWMWLLIAAGNWAIQFVLVRLP